MTEEREPPGGHGPTEPREPTEPRQQTEPPGPMAPTEPPDPPERRPIVERIGMAAIALVFATLFGGVTIAAFSGGEPFLGVMAGIGCLMTLWVGGITLFRG